MCLLILLADCIPVATPLSFPPVKPLRERIVLLSHWKHRVFPNKRHKILTIIFLTVEKNMVGEKIQFPKKLPENVIYDRRLRIMLNHHETYRYGKSRETKTPFVGKYPISQTVFFSNTILAYH